MSLLQNPKIYVISLILCSIWLCDSLVIHNLMTCSPKKNILSTTSPFLSNNRGYFSRQNVNSAHTGTHKDFKVEEDTDILPKEGSSLFDWKRHWYPIIPVQDLDKSVPNPLSLLDIKLVAWFHSPSSSWRVFKDECPHRLVPLSEGRIESNSNCLQCAYHGWEFNEAGSCTKIPQQVRENSLSPSKACTISYPAQVQQGLLWVFPFPDEIESQKKNPNTISQFDDDSFADSTQFFVRDLPYSWDILIENLCDPSHIPFAHHGIIRGADRDNPEQYGIEITHESIDGFRAQKDPYPLNGKYDIRFEPPCLLFYDIVKTSEKKNEGETSKEGKQDTNTYIGLGNYCIPTGPGKCRIITRFPFKFPSAPIMKVIKATPRWFNHLSQNEVIDSDVVFLHAQDQILQKSMQRRNQPKYYLPAKCDTMVIAFRKWLDRYTDKKVRGWMNGQDQLEVSSRLNLLDRFEQHTKVCSSCRIAHKNFKRLDSTCFGLGLIAVAIAASGLFPKQKMALTTTGVFLSLVIPRTIIKPLISRLEYIPWPSMRWKKNNAPRK